MIEALERATGGNNIRRTWWWFRCQSTRGSAPKMRRGDVCLSWVVQVSHGDGCLHEVLLTNHKKLWVIKLGSKAKILKMHHCDQIWCGSLHVRNSSYLPLGAPISRFWDHLWTKPYHQLKAAGSIGPLWPIYNRVYTKKCPRFFTIPYQGGDLGEST